MESSKLIQIIQDTYGEFPEHPWDDNNIVFRHSNNRKWFALLMCIPKCKLGIHEEGMIDVVNLKATPMLVSSFRTEPGVYPAYHMSKAHWLTLALDGSCTDETIRMLLNISYDLTAVKSKKQPN